MKVLRKIVVTGLSPKSGSLAGGTILTITGSGFPADYFVTDVKVLLVPDLISRKPSSDWKSNTVINCDIIPYKSTTTYITCRTRSITVDLATVGTLRTPNASCDPNAVNGDTQAADGLMQIVSWQAALDNDFKADFKVLVLTGDLDENNVVSTSLFGKLSGDLIPQMDIQPYGYSAISAMQLRYDGSGSSLVITAVDQEFISSSGNAYISLRGTGLIPVDSIDIKGTGMLSADTASSIFSLLEPRTILKPDSSQISIYSKSLSEWPNLFTVMVGGVRCQPVEFFWSVTKDNNHQQIGCLVETIKDLNSLVPGSRGVTSQVFSNSSLLQDPINTMLIGAKPDSIKVFHGGFDEIISANNWSSSTIAQKFTTFFRAPLSSNYSFFISRDVTSSAYKSTVDLFLTRNGNRSRISSFKPGNSNLDNVNGVSGKWSEMFDLRIDEYVHIEIIEWLPNGGSGSGKPIFYTKLMDIPANSTSEARGGPSNCTFCGMEWTWDTDRTASISTGYQTVEFDSGPLKFSSTVSFTLSQDTEQVYNKSMPKNNNWVDVDGKGWNAGLENVRVSWGTSNGYFLLNSQTTEEKAESLFYSNILTANCAWKYDPSRSVYDYDSFENESDLWYGGVAITQTTQFCGKSAMSITYGSSLQEYPEEQINQYNTNFTQSTFSYNTDNFPYICMAFKAEPQVPIQMIIDMVGYGLLSVPLISDAWTYSPVGSWSSSFTYDYNPGSKEFDMKNTPIIEKNIWQYRCINLKQQIEQMYGENKKGTINRKTKKFDPVGGYIIDSVRFMSKKNTFNSNKYFYIDQFSISSQPIPLVQLSPLSMGVNGTMIESVSISRVPLVNSIAFVIDLYPTECGASVDTPLIVFDSQQSGSFSLTDTIKGKEGFNLLAESEVISYASPPIQGWYSLQFKDFPPVNLSTSMSPVEYELAFQSAYAKSSKSLPIEVSGYSTCHAFSYTLFLKGFAGSQPKFKIIESNIIGGGPTHNLTTTKNKDGALTLIPVPADLLYMPIDITSISLTGSNATFFNLPVSLSVNGLTASCNGSNCLVKLAKTPDFSMPSIFSVEPKVLYPGCEVSIIGRNLASWEPIFSQNSLFEKFTSNISQDNLSVSNKVTFYNNEIVIMCHVQFRNETFISCRTENGYSSGVPLALNVQVPLFGSALPANSDISISVEYLLDVTEIAPALGSTVGGTLLTISGQGFSAFNNMMNVKFKSTKNNKETVATCIVLSSNHASFTCLTAPVNLNFNASQLITETDVEINILNKLNGAVIKSFVYKNGFTFSSNMTAEVQSITPNAGSFLGGDLVTITGSNLLPAAGNVSVYFGTKSCEVKSVTSSSVNCITPSFKPNSNFEISMITGFSGYAAISANVTFDYKLTVFNTTKTSGSFHGGQNITVLGEGFCPRGVSDCHKTANYSISMGRVVFSNYTNLIVNTSPLVTRHNVQLIANFTPAVPVFKFSPADLEIIPGDIVNIDWADAQNTYNNYTGKIDQISNVFQIILGKDSFSFPPNNQGFSSLNKTLSSIEIKFQYVGLYNYMNDFFKCFGKIYVLSSKQRQNSEFSFRISSDSNEVTYQSSDGKNGLVKREESSGSNVTGITYLYRQELTSTIKQFKKLNTTQFEVLGENFSLLSSVVWIGKAKCASAYVNSTVIQCNTDQSLPGGIHNVFVSDENGHSQSVFYKETIVENGIGLLNQGSFGGGTTIDIYGDHFLSSNTAYKLSIGGSDCKVVYAEKTNLRCTTGKLPDYSAFLISSKSLLKSFSYKNQNVNNSDKTQNLEFNLYEGGTFSKLNTSHSGTFANATIEFWMKPDIGLNETGMLLSDGLGNKSNTFMFVYLPSGIVEYWLKTDMNATFFTNGSVNSDENGWVSRDNCTDNMLCGGLKILEKNYNVNVSDTTVSVWSVVRNYLSISSGITHIVGMRTNNLQQLFVNATKSSSRNLDSNITPFNFNDLYAGGNANLLSYFGNFIGYIDNISIFTTSLPIFELESKFLTVLDIYRFNVDIKYVGSSFGDVAFLPFNEANVESLKLDQFVSNSSIFFNYKKSLTPFVNLITPAEGIVGTVVNITGTGFTNKSTVSLGNSSCKVIYSGNDLLQCLVQEGVLGYKKISVHESTLGNAFMNVDNSFKFTINLLSVQPNIASVSGSTMVNIRISPSPKTYPFNGTVFLGASPCEIQFWNSTLIQCLTAPTMEYFEGMASVFPTILIDNSVNASFTNCPISDCGFQFGITVTPNVTSISPTIGYGGDTVTIIGTGIGNNAAFVDAYLGDFILTINSLTVSGNNTILTGIIPEQETAIVGVQVSRNGYGLSSAKVKFTYNHRIDGFDSPLSSGVNGGTTLKIFGKGFGAGSTVKICDKLCITVNFNVTSISCIVPAFSDNASSLNSNSISCPIVLSNVNAAPLTASFNFTYETHLTAKVVSISPTIGGTAGGTFITITGTGFNGTINSTSVSIGNADCKITFLNQTTINCITGKNNNGGKFPPVITSELLGSSHTNDDVQFWYMDRWSSRFTWGNQDLPSIGQSVWIAPNQVVMLDVDTPRLNLVLIEGTLLFDLAKNITLEATYIFIHNGGKLKIGSKDVPYINQGRIRLWGNIRTKPLPIYGSKVLALRNGQLDIFGAPLNSTWTHLEKTAEKNSNELSLNTFVDWPVGGKIVVASTSFNPHDAETAHILDMKVGKFGTILKLDANLNFTHSGVESVVNGHKISYKAEVGLLSRNIVIEGVLNNGKASPISDSYDDQFGGHIMVHPSMNAEVPSHAQLSFVELYHMGQAFQLGRYPIHWHLNPTVGNNSFVEGCSIHESFNRAITAHGVTSLTIKDNVAYNIMGHTYFVEDGIEENNSFIGNLGILTKKSYSLLNTDQIPATFWITNPNNNYVNNSAAGSEGSGFFIDLQNHPTGPSETVSVCPVNKNLGSFFNNKAHSNDFGFRIWERYIPSSCECCGMWYPMETQFLNLTTWGNNVGVEITEGGALQFVNLKSADNRYYQFALDRISVPENYWKSYLTNSVIMSHSIEYIKSMESDSSFQFSAVNFGIHTPNSLYFQIDSTTFVNFDTYGGINLVPCSGCHHAFDGGYEARFSKISYINSTKNVVGFHHNQEAWFTDLDGTLSGSPGMIMPNSDLLPKEYCFQDISSYSLGVNFWGGVNGSWCSNDVKVTKLQIRYPDPWYQFWGKDIKISNMHGSMNLKWEHNRQYWPGYMALIASDLSYNLDFNPDNLAPVDPTYFTLFMPYIESWVIFNVKMVQDVDHFTVYGNNIASNTSLTLLDNTGTWTYDNATNVNAFIVNGNQGSHSKWVDWSVSYCPISGCPSTEVPDTEQPNSNSTEISHFFVWSDVSFWPNNTLPTAMEDVYINGTTQVALDVDTHVRNIYISGILRFDDSKDIFLNATNIFVLNGGKFLIGDESTPFEHNAVITLFGNRTTNTTTFSERLHGLSKSITVFGELKIIGQLKTSVPWTVLSRTALMGMNEISLSESVDWNTGDKIVIASTNYDASESEVVTISSISNDGRIITLSTPLMHTHASFKSDLPGNRGFDMSAEVMLLNRNIVIQGAEDETGALELQKYGARILVSGLNNVRSDQGGFAVLKNVEIRNAGQSGFLDYLDYRAAITFDYGEVGLNQFQTSIVENCVVHDTYNSAIAVMAIDTPFVGYGPIAATLKNNIVFNTLESSFKIFAEGVSLTENLALLTKYTTYSFQLDSEASRYIGTYESMGTTNILINNRAAGSESVGFIIVGQKCGEWENIADNIAHSNMYGALVYSSTDTQTSCTTLENFSTYKNWIIGIFPFLSDSFIGKNLLVADSRAGFLGATVGPRAAMHELVDKFFTIENSIFIGSTNDKICVQNHTPPKVTAPFTFGSAIPTAGIIFSLFADSSALILPEDFMKKGKHLMRNLLLKMFNFNIGDLGHVHSWPIINGKVSISDTIFINYTVNEICNETSYAVTNFFNEMDASKPHYIKNTKLINVSEKAKVYFYEPNPSWITPSLCVSMDCDGPKHSLLIDTDGSFFERTTRSTAVAAAELRFNPERIPAVMRTTMIGTVVDLEEFASNYGIYRNNSKCQFHGTYYLCEDTIYEMLVIESLDSDSQSRTISPVGILAEDADQGNFIDLLNGPKNMGWCGSDSCLRKMSTFFGVVATNNNYRIGFTGTVPQSLRFLTLNGSPTDKLKVVIDWPTWQSLTVYVDGNKVDSTDYNVTHTNSNTKSSYIPDLSYSIGSNHFDSVNLQLTLILGSNLPIIIKSTPTVVLTFGLTSSVSLDANAFFDTGSLINNLASFLQISPINIRVVNVVSENSLSKRSATISGSVTFSIVSKPPADSFVVKTPTSTDSTEAAIENLSTELDQFNDANKEISMLNQNAQKVISAVQLGTGSSVFSSASVSSIKIAFPPPASVPQLPANLLNTTIDSSLIKLLADSQIAANSTKDNSASTIDFQIPEELKNLNEMQSVYVKKLPTFSFKVIDKSQQLVEKLGIDDTAWYLYATLIFDNTSSSVETGKLENPKLLGTTLKPFENGTVSFSDLEISVYGLNYSLNFVPVSQKLQISKFSYNTGEFQYLEESSEVATASEKNNMTLIAVIIGSVAFVFIVAGASFAAISRKKKKRDNFSRVAPFVNKEKKLEEGISINVSQQIALRSAEISPIISEPEEQTGQKEEVDKSSEFLGARSPAAVTQKPKTFYEVMETYVPDKIFQDELSLEIGDIIHVTSVSSDNEWFFGHSLSKNHTGRFPSRFVSAIKDDDSRLSSIYKTTIMEHNEHHLIPLNVLPALRKIEEKTEYGHTNGASEQLVKVNEGTRFISIESEIGGSEMGSYESLEGAEVYHGQVAKRHKEQTSIRAADFESPFAVPDYY
ncbi:Fibrocystin-L [Clydaea vesicula]|uniref:Fibrocystin-L n=1 Tax=Clydaea vesicula TaxID=447962 RepID=A0AAD5UBH4_9FUNG|nr:Fibrocystin-L [Clydaea vesicula]